MGNESGREVGRSHETTIVEPGTLEKLGIRVTLLEHRESVYVGGHAYSLRTAPEKPNLKTDWQKVKLRYLRSERAAGRSVTNAKFYGRPSELGSGMHIVIAHGEKYFAEGIDNVDDEDGERVPENEESYLRKFSETADDEPGVETDRVVGICTETDDRDKFTEKLRDCFLLVAFGDKSSGSGAPEEPQSFLGHLNPEVMFDEDFAGKYERMVVDALSELKEKCLDGSFRFVLGCSQVRSPEQAQRYWKAVRHIGGIIHRETGVYPSFMVPPNTDPISADQHVYVRTKEQRIIVSTPPQKGQDKWREPLMYSFAEFESKLHERAISGEMRSG